MSSITALAVATLAVLATCAQATCVSGVGTPQFAVELGGAGNFTVLSKTGITNVPGSAITGNVGTSPITGAAIGLECTEVSPGEIYTADAAGPMPCYLTETSMLQTATDDMKTAYNDAAARECPKEVDLGAGDIGGMTLTAGLYKWNSAVTISADVYLTGTSTDIFVFQVSKGVVQASATMVHLLEGVQAENIFWQVAEEVNLGTTAHCEGIFLSATGIHMKTGASVNGRLLAETAVTLQSNTIVATTMAA